MTFELPTYDAKELTDMVAGITQGLDTLCKGNSDDFVQKIDVRQGGYSVHIKGTDRPGIGICTNLARITNPALVLQLASQLLDTMEVPE